MRVARGIAVGVVAVAAIWVLWKTVGIWSQFGASRPDLSEVRNLTGLWLPPHAVLAHSRFRRLPRPWLTAKIYIPASEVDEVKVRQTQMITEWESGPAIGGELQTSDLWEQPVDSFHTWAASFRPPARKIEPSGQPFDLGRLTVAVLDSETAVVYAQVSGS